MITKANVKRAFWVFMDILLILFVLPFGFVMAYFFPLLFSGENRIALLEDLAGLSLSLSRVSCVFLFVIGLVIRAMMKRQFRWYALFAVSCIGGGVWLLLWNLAVESNFTLWRSLFPLALCSAVATVYALSKALYKDDSWNFADQPLLDFHEESLEQEGSPVFVPPAELRRGEQESGDGDQESAVRDQESGDGDQESGDGELSGVNRKS